MVWATKYAHYMLIMLLPVCILLLNTRYDVSESLKIFKKDLPDVDFMDMGLNPNEIPAVMIVSRSKISFPPHSNLFTGHTGLTSTDFLKSSALCSTPRCQAGWWHPSMNFEKY